MRHITRKSILVFTVALLAAILPWRGLAAVSASKHKHEWRYTAQGNNITAHCDGEGVCDVTEGLTLTLTPPTELQYDGEEKPAALNEDFSREAFGKKHTITYARSGESATDRPPVDAGTWTASVGPKSNIEAPQARVTFTIAKADLVIPQHAEAVNSSLDGEAHPLVKLPAALPTGCAMVQFSLDGGITWEDEIPTSAREGSYTVNVRYLGDVNHNDTMGAPVTAVIDAKPNGLVIATMVAEGNDAFKVTWTEAHNVDGYDVFLKECADKSDSRDVAASVQGTEATLTGLKKNTSYKASVWAWVLKGDQKEYVLDHSPVVHAITGGYRKGTVNPASLRINKSRTTVKIDRSVRIGGTIKGVKSGRLLKHEPRLRYISTDTNVAVINNKGDVTGVGPGTCTVYVLTNNGIWQSVAVTVDAEPDSVWFQKKQGSMKVGSQLDLGARVKLWPGKSQTVLTWTSSDDAIARVDDKGVVTGVRTGEATITVTATNGEHARVKLKVK